MERQTDKTGQIYETVVKEQAKTRQHNKQRTENCSQLYPIVVLPHVNVIEIKLNKSQGIHFYFFFICGNWIEWYSYSALPFNYNIIFMY